MGRIGRRELLGHQEIAYLTGRPLSVGPVRIPRSLGLPSDTGWRPFFFGVARAISTPCCGITLAAGRETRLLLSFIHVSRGEGAVRAAQLAGFPGGEIHYAPRHQIPFSVNSIPWFSRNPWPAAP